jgi:hypothetical protein
MSIKVKRLVEVKTALLKTNLIKQQYESSEYCLVYTFIYKSASQIVINIVIS